MKMNRVLSMSSSYLKINQQPFIPGDESVKMFH